MADRTELESLGNNRDGGAVIDKAGSVPETTHTQKYEEGSSCECGKCPRVVEVWWFDQSEIREAMPGMDVDPQEIRAVACCAANSANTQ